MLVLEARPAFRALCGVALIAALTTGCAADDPGAGSAAPAPDALVADAGAAAPGPAEAAPPADPDAPLTYTPVKRPGRAAAAVKAAVGRLAAGAPVTYHDGVSVTVERVTRTTEQGGGIGAFPGRPLTAVTFRLTNGSAQTVDLSQVVVTTRYGTSPKLATPVYTEAAQDFAGAVAPGGTTVATYVFSLPPGQAEEVDTWVDFDAVHAPAGFSAEVL